MKNVRKFYVCEIVDEDGGLIPDAIHFWSTFELPPSLLGDGEEAEELRTDVKILNQMDEDNVKFLPQIGKPSSD